MKKKLSSLKPPLLLGLAAGAALMVYLTTRGSEPEPPPAPIETGARPEPEPVLASGNLRDGHAVGETPRRGGVTNESVMKAMQDEADEMKITGIAPRTVTRRHENAYQAMAAAELAEPGSREEVLAYMRRFRAVQSAWSRSEQPTVPVGGQTPRVLEAPGTGTQRPADDRGYWEGLYAGSNARGTRTISDAAEWKRVWAGLSTAPAPAVDFSMKQVVAVFAGHRASGGFIVEIAKVSLDEAAVTVAYRELAPPAGITPPQGATAPFALKVIPRSTLPVRFVKLE